MSFKLHALNSVVQGSYWMLYATIISFSSVFLLARGYSNSTIGIIIAAGFAAALILQPLIANISDNSKKFSLSQILLAVVFIMLLMSFGLMFCGSKSLYLTLLYIAIIAWHTAVQPLINSFSFYLEKTGIPVSFGICRAAGSVLYAIVTTVIGVLLSRFGVNAVPATSIVVTLLFVLTLLLISRTMRAASRTQTVIRSSGEDDEFISFKDFIRRNKMFFIFSIGIAGIYFGHTVQNTFTIQIVEDVGGTSQDMGMLLSFMAMCELPGMIFFTNLNRHFKSSTLIKVSAMGFLVKMVIVWLADSVFLLYVGHAVQMVGLGLFLPATVHFIQEVMSNGEAVRGQSVYTIMITVSTILSSLTGGFIIDAFSIKTLLFVSTILTLAGTFVIVFTVEKVRESKKSSNYRRNAYKVSASSSSAL